MPEQSKKFELPSGAVIAITTAPFQDASALAKASLRALKGMTLSQADLSKDFESLGAAVSAVPAVFDRLISIATSDEIEAAMFKCATRALYIPKGSPMEFPGMRIDQSLFDDVDHGGTAREDYVMIALRIIEVNCKPFLARALSGLGALKKEEAASDVPSSKST